jgi:transcriptional repressor NrdR
MRCPFCSDEDTQVKDSRPSEDGMSIRRRRYCPACNSRFTTFERVQLRELIVVKKNGERKPFDRDKVSRSISMAVRKRSISAEQVEMIISNIVRNLEALGESEIPTSLIGEMIMKELATLDQVAYVRFASVYKEFREAEDFGKFIKLLTPLKNG